MWPANAARLRARTRGQWAFVAACAMVVAVQWVVILHRRAAHIGDFDVSREFGRRFLAGEYLYAGGLHYPYMPTAAMFFSPLALVAPGVGLLLRYAAAAAALWLTLGMLHRMVRERGANIAGKRFTIAALTLALGSPYILRDLDDGGPHLILLALLAAATFAVWNGRERLGATCFGLAAALKAPAGLFLPFLVWKREWRLTAYTAGAAICWIVLPMVWMGPMSWSRHQAEWTRNALASALGHPSPGAAESEQRVQNQALRPALLRSLGGPPEGRGGGPSGAGPAWSLGLDPAWAGRAATATMLGLLALCCWAGRRPYSARRDPAWPLECSAVLILGLVFSPVTWLQHMVFLVPALYLIVAEDRGIRRLGIPASAAMGAYVVLALVLNHEMLGRDRSLIVLSHGTHTLCMLLLLGVILARRPTAGPPASPG